MGSGDQRERKALRGLSSVQVVARNGLGDKSCGAGPFDRVCDGQGGQGPLALFNGVDDAVNQLPVDEGAHAVVNQNRLGGRIVECEQGKPGGGLP